LPVREKAFRRRKRPVGKSKGGRNVHPRQERMAVFLRAVDKDGNTIDFLLRVHRDKTAAQHYFEKSIDQNGEPETVTIDKSGANRPALDAPNARRDTPIKMRQNMYLNNIIEQDHRTVMRRTRPMLGFKTVRSARIPLGSIELMHTITKAQLKTAVAATLPPSSSTRLSNKMF
jgi:transposase-like protein